MEVAIVTTVLGAVLSTALPELMRQALGRINNDADSSSIQSLIEEMGSIRARVEHYHRSRKDMSFEWRSMITSLRHLAYKIEDCIDQVKIGKITNAKFATEIKGFETSLKKQFDDLDQYIKRGLLSYSGAQGQHVEDDDEDQIGLVGMEEPLNDLLALVLNPPEEKPKVISIVGFAGIGKTRLADELYRQRSTDLLLHASVRATAREEKEVLVEILTKLHSLIPGSSTQAVPDNAARTSQTLMSAIRTHLRSHPRKRYFIVIDDVQDKKLGNRVIREFRNAKDIGGIIIVTTTVHSVAEGCSSGSADHVYKMRPLSVQDCGMLFSNEHCRRYSEPAPHKAELESIGIGKECDGIPLAVITMAEFLQGDISRCRTTTWSEICVPADEGHMPSRMQQVLKHCYDSLPSIDLQTCLLYLSMFPREHPIRRGSLVRQWLAEGAEVGCGNYSGDNVAAIRNLNSLIERNVIWPIQVSTNEGQEAKTCRSARAMLGYISHESKPEGFVVRVSDNEPCRPQFIRRLSLQTGDVSVLENKDAVSRLRTLVVSPGKNKPAALSFDKCELLRVLDLEAWHAPEKIDLNRKICKKLLLLKYLSLRGEIINSVPKQMEELKYLETLDVGEKDVVLVHVNVIKMPSLKHLIGKFQLMRGKYALLPYPKEFERIHLETLAGFETKDGQGFPPLMHYMSRLRKVKIFFHQAARTKKLTARLAEAIKDFIGTPSDSDAQGERRFLSIDFQSCSPLLLESQPQEDGLKIFSLKLRGTTGQLERFPVFGVNLSGVTKLCVAWTNLVLKFNTENQPPYGKNEKPAPTFLDVVSKMKGLMYLKLVAHVIDTAFDPNQTAGDPQKGLVIKSGHFKNLKRLCLVADNSLTNITIEAEALNNLVSLHLICKDLGVPSTVIQPLSGLKEVALHADVKEKTKTTWQQAARDHANRPQVVLMEQESG